MKLAEVIVFSYHTTMTRITSYMTSIHSTDIMMNQTLLIVPLNHYTPLVHKLYATQSLSNLSQGTRMLQFGSSSFLPSTFFLKFSNFFH